MPETRVIRVLGTEGESSPFHADRFAGFLGRMGHSADRAVALSREVEIALLRSGRDRVTTDELRHVAADLSIHGTDRLAAERATAEVVGGLEPVSAAAAVATTPERRGPCGAVRVAFDAAFGALTGTSPRLGKAALLCVELAERQVNRTLLEFAPAIVDVVRRSELLADDALQRFKARLIDGVSALPPDRRQLEQLTRLLHPVVTAPGTRLEGVLADALNEALPPDLPQPPHGGGAAPPFPVNVQPPSIDVIPPGRAYVKVGSLERMGGGPLAANFPLYCHETEEGEESDDLDAVDVTYLGSALPALEVEDGPWGNGQQVSTGWRTELRADLPQRYMHLVPLGIDVSIYQWHLVENDEMPGLLGRLQDLLRQLEEKKKEIQEKAGKAAKDGVGAAAGLVGIDAPDFVGKAAEQLAEALTGWLIDLVIDLLGAADPFPTVSVAHLTSWPSGKSPMSLVVCSTSSVQDDASRVIELGRLRPDGQVATDFVGHKAERTARWWWGASQPAGPLPYELVRRLPAESAPAIAWRAPRHGFGAIVKQVNLDDDSAIYVVCLRADVRLVPLDELPPGTSGVWCSPS